MRISKLPPEALDRLDVIDRHAGALARAATLAEAELAKTRATLAGNFEKTGRMKDDLGVYEAAKRDFDSIHKGALAARKCADDAQKVASACKFFVDRLPDSAELELVEPPKANGLDLGTVRARAAELSAKITRYKSMAPPSDRALVEGFVDAVRAPAEAQVSALIRRWPHFCSVEGLRMMEADVDIALMTALISRAQMVDFLVARIDAQADAAAPPSERGAKISEMESELATLQVLESMYVNKAISDGATSVAHSADAPPWIVLGISVVERERLAS